jgi:hypothetical protein
MAAPVKKYLQRKKIYIPNTKARAACDLVNGLA